MQLDTSPAVLPEGVRPCRTRIGSTTGSNVMARQKRGIVDVRGLTQEKYGFVGG